MIVQHDDLVNLLMKHGSFDRNDASPKEVLGINFSSILIKSNTTVTYETVEGGTLAVDLDEDGRVISIDII